MVSRGVERDFRNGTVRVDRLAVTHRGHIANITDFVPQNAVDQTAGIHIRNRRQFAIGIGSAQHAVGPQQILFVTGSPAVVIRRNVQTPGLEGVIHTDQRGAQLREVTVQNVHHGVVLNPVVTFLGIDFRVVVRREEAVGDDAARGVHDEDLERGFTEGKAFRTHGFRHHADHGVDHFNVVVVQTLQVGHGGGIAGQVFKLGDRVQTDLTTEFVVTRYTTLAVTDHVDGGDVHFTDDWQIQIAQEFRVVVQHQSARVGDTEGVPQAVRAFVVENVFSIAIAGVFNRDAVAHHVGTDVVDVDGITHQRVHAVNRHEFFGQREGNASVVRLTRTGQTGQCPFQERGIIQSGGDFRVYTQNAAQPGIFLRQVGIYLVQFGTELVAFLGVTSQTPPVGVHGALGNRVGDDGWRPFYGVNFRHQRGVDQARFVVQPLVIFARVICRQHIGNGVVLFHEQLMQHAQTDPPVIGEAGFRYAGKEFARQSAIRVNGQTATLEFTDAVGRCQIAAVNLRTIPPVGVEVAVAVRQVCFLCGTGRIGLGTTHFQYA